MIITKTSSSYSEPKTPQFKEHQVRKIRRSKYQSCDDLFLHWDVRRLSETQANVLRIGSRCSKYLQFWNIITKQVTILSRAKSLIFGHLRGFSLQRLMCLGWHLGHSWTSWTDIWNHLKLNIEELHSSELWHVVTHQVQYHFNQKPTKVSEEHLILLSLHQTWWPKLHQIATVLQICRDLQPGWEEFPLELPWHILMILDDPGICGVCWFGEVPCSLGPQNQVKKPEALGSSSRDSDQGWSGSPFSYNACWCSGWCWATITRNGGI